MRGVRAVTRMCCQWQHSKWAAPPWCGPSSSLKWVQIRIRFFCECGDKRLIQSSRLVKRARELFVCLCKGSPPSSAKWSSSLAPLDHLAISLQRPSAKEDPEATVAAVSATALQTLPSCGDGHADCSQVGQHKLNKQDRGCVFRCCPRLQLPFLTGQLYSKIHLLFIIFRQL